VYSAGGQWRTLLDAEALDRYWARIRRLAKFDLVAWTHGGWLRYPSA
jgi:hypothetical protein